MNRQYKFVQWQNLYIESIKYGTISLNHAIQYFIRDGLTPFLKSYGYTFEVNSSTVENIIASTMYKISYDNLYTFPVRGNVYFHDEHYQHFEYIISTEDWDHFFIFWNRMLDDIFTEAISTEIKCISWMLIDINKSDAVIQYLESLEDSDNEVNNDNKNSIDPYLLEQMNHYTQNPKFVFEK
jgi:hypothetical protein